MLRPSGRILKLTCNLLTLRFDTCHDILIHRPIKEMNQAESMANYKIIIFIINTDAVAGDLEIFRKLDYRRP